MVIRWTAAGRVRGSLVFICTIIRVLYERGKHHKEDRPRSTSCPANDIRRLRGPDGRGPVLQNSEPEFDPGAGIWRAHGLKPHLVKTFNNGLTRDGRVASLSSPSTPWAI